MDRCGFSPEQQNFIWQWIRREINLVANTTEEEIGEIVETLHATSLQDDWGNQKGLK